MYLGIDIGTSSVKAILMVDDGHVIAQSSHPLPISRPKPLWSEQSPHDWWVATEAAVLSLPAAYRTAVRGIGLSGQMHGATLLDRDGRVLRPAILWNDGRSHAECRDLETREPSSRHITGNLAMPGFTAPKLLWVKKHEAEIFAQIDKVLLPKDYIRLLMTGTFASDMSDAAGTLWLDVEGRQWSVDMLAACDLAPSHMPSLVEGTEAAGTLRREVAEKWGMSSVPVAGGGGDNAAGAIGVGVVNPGDAFISLGTSGVIFVAGDRFAPNPDSGVHAFCHALPGKWHEMTVMLSAASCIDWATRITPLATAKDVTAAAEQFGRLDNDLFFLPYLSGERTPHNDPYARGVLFGLDHDTAPQHIAQAVLEGVALAFADGLNVLRDSSAVSTLTVIGGGARSAYWGRILSAALNRPLVYRRDADVGPAYGAAKLAQLATGDGTIDDVCRAPAVLETISPHTGDVEIMAEKRRRFGQLYQQLKPLFPRGNES